MQSPGAGVSLGYELGWLDAISALLQSGVCQPPVCYPPCVTVGLPRCLSILSLIHSPLFFLGYSCVCVRMLMRAHVCTHGCV